MFSSCVSFVLMAASAPSPAAAAYAFDTSEAAFDAAYLKKTIGIGGKVVDETGKDITDATVTVIGFGAAATNTVLPVTTDPMGNFTLSGLLRRSVLLKITRPGSYTEIVPVDLQRPDSEGSVTLGKIVMTAQKSGRTRLIFVGDTMFGRRFTDADEDGKQGEPGDLINPATRAADARKIVTFVRDAISSADYAIANLECTVTANPATPHPYKSYTFYSHPETLAGLTHAGFDGVDLANNHVFDYLGAGVVDTINAVAGADLDWTGAGLNETDAIDTTISTKLSDVPVALQGFSTLRKDGSSLTKYLLVALDPDKAGALEATAPNMSDFLGTEADSRFAVPMIHGGVEYSSYPANNMRAIFVSLINQGAGMVVAHHTHTMHGIGIVDPGSGPRFVLMSLGNFIFDQSSFETTQSLIAVADVETKLGGQEVTRLQLIPVHVEAYVPKLLAGGWLTRTARQLGHLSTPLPKTPSGSATADSLTGATVFQSGSQVLAFKSASQYSTTTSVDAPLKQPLSSGATGPIEYQRTTPADSLALVKTGTTAVAEYGRDILLYGDFEDSDVDDAYSEGWMWSQSESRYLENSVVHGGTGAAVLLRKSSNDSTVSLSNYRDVPIPGGAKLTISGWVRGVNAGTFKVATRILDDGNTLSTTDRFTRSAGSYAWTRFSVDLTAPSSATDLRLYFKQSPPNSGEGQVFVDDVVVILWEGKVSDAKAGFSLPTPNNYGFLRFTGASGTALDVSLTHRTYTAL